MPRPFAQIAFAGLLLAPAGLAAQPAAAPAAKPAAEPVVKPAPRAAVQSAPLVRPKPGVHGTPSKPPANPSANSSAKPSGRHARPVHAAPKPAAPVVVPAPAAEPEPEKSAEPAKGSNTGAPLPRFAALRSDEVNLRTGPGTRYPIEWLYKRRDLPVQIEREFEVWRLIRDQEGVKGWVNQAVLAPRRTGIVIGAEHSLRRDPRDDATALARLKPGVILRLRSCEANAEWCQASVQDYRGWIKRTDIWGTFPGEAVQ